MSNSNNRFTKPNYSGTLAIGDSMPVLKRFVARGASALTGVDLSGCTQIEEIDLDGSERVSVVNIPQGAPLHSYVVPPSAGFNLELRGLTELKDKRSGGRYGSTFSNCGGYATTTNNAYVDLGVAFDSDDMSFEVSYMSTANANYNVILGTSSSVWDWNASLLLFLGNTTLNFGPNASVNVNHNIFHVVKYANGVWNIDGTAKNSTPTKSSNTIRLFRGNGKNNVNNRIYYFKLWKGDTLVREVYPAVDDDGVACMYDYVEDKYYYDLSANAGHTLSVSSEVYGATAYAGKVKLGLVINKPALVGGLTIHGCPQIDTFALALKCIKAKDSQLQRIDIECGDVTGGIHDLYLLSQKGIMLDPDGNTVPNGNVKIKGHYTVNGFVTDKLMKSVGYDPDNSNQRQASSIIQGLEISIDRENLPDILLQSFDENDVGFNPGACVVCNQKGWGQYIDDSNPTLGWYITKQEAAKISVNLRDKQGSVTDTNKILPGQLAGTTYDKNNTFAFNELRYFTGGDPVLYGVQYISEITIPEGRTTGTEALWNTIRLTKITIPKSCTPLGQNAISYVNTVVYEGTDEEFINDYLPKKERGIGVVMNIRYLNKYGNPIKITYIPEGIKKVVGHFWDMSSEHLLFTSLPNSVVELGSQAFQGKTLALKSFGNITFFGDNCFRDSNINIEEIPKDATFIGAYVFMNCKSLQKITIPSGVTSLGRQCFDKCTSLESIELPNTFENIGAYCFDGNTKLELTSLPDTITSIGDGAFRDCKKIGLVKLPSKLTAVAYAAFQNCTNLALTELPSGVTSIGQQAFQNCTNLALTELPSGVTSIGLQAFYNCTNLALTELPSGVTSIGLLAFMGCTKCFESDIDSPFNWPPLIMSVGQGAFYDTAMKTWEVNLKSTTTMPNSKYDWNTNSQFDYIIFDEHYTAGANNVQFSRNNAQMIWLRNPTPITLGDTNHNPGVFFVGEGKSITDDMAIATAYRAATNWNSTINNIQYKIQPLALIRVGLGLSNLSYYQGDVVDVCLGTTTGTTHIYTNFFTEGVYIVQCSGSIYVNRAQWVNVYQTKDRWDDTNVDSNGNPNLVNFANFASGVKDIKNQYYVLRVPAKQMARVAFTNGVSGADTIEPTTAYTQYIQITKQ